MQQSDELKNVIGALDTDTCSTLQKAGFTLQPLNELWCGNCRPVNPVSHGPVESSAGH